jgi:hypothetical protein
LWDSRLIAYEQAVYFLAVGPKCLAGSLFQSLAKRSGLMICAKVGCLRQPVGLLGCARGACLKIRIDGPVGIVLERVTGAQRVTVQELAKQLGTSAKPARSWGTRGTAFYRFQELYEKGGELALPARG